jgi:hypothetical protein
MAAVRSILPNAYSPMPYQHHFPLAIHEWKTATGVLNRDR